MKKETLEKLPSGTKIWISGFNNKGWLYDSDFLFSRIDENGFVKILLSTDHIEYSDIWFHPSAITKIFRKVKKPKPSFAGYMRVGSCSNGKHRITSSLYEKKHSLDKVVLDNGSLYEVFLREVKK